MCTEGKRIESKPVCLAKQNDLKQSFMDNSSRANVKYKPRKLMTKNNKCCL